MGNEKIKNQDNETLKAGCIVLNDKKEILLVALIGAEKWSFPKGHIEKNEDPESTATREALEETGYKIEIIKKLPDITYTIEAKNELVRITMFLAKPIEKINIPEKETRSDWFEINKARGVIYPNLVSVLEDLSF